MTDTPEQIAAITSGLPSDYHDDANALAKRAWAALKDGRGMRLSRDEVIALHQMEGDGDWWNSFNPAVRAALQGEKT